MTEHPVICSTPMIHAILEGRKTQRRLVLKPQPNPLGTEIIKLHADRSCWLHLSEHNRLIALHSMPYQPGDTLWVQEKWATDAPDLDTCRRGVESDGPPYGPYYWATATEFDRRSLRWRSPRHMPRWASRITLRVTDVRVERVQDISESDAIAEGVTAPAWGARDAFRSLWDSRNAKRGYGWDTNPWVSVTTFERGV